MVVDTSWCVLKNRPGSAEHLVCKITKEGYLVPSSVTTVNYFLKFVVYCCCLCTFAVEKLSGDITISYSKLFISFPVGTEEYYKEKNISSKMYN